MKKYAVLGLLLWLLAACGGGEQAQTASDAAASAAASAQTVIGQQHAGWPTYLVGSELSYPPFQFVKDQQNGADGFELELLQVIAQAEQFNIKVVNTPRKSAFQTLDSGERDIWASAFSANAETEAKALLSKPFLDFEFTIYVLDSPENKGVLVSPDSFKGKKLAVSQYSQYAKDAAAKLTEVPKNVIAAPSLYLALKEVYLKRADGVLSDSRVLAYYKLRNPEIATRSIPLGDPPKHLVFMVKKGNRELMDKINRGLDKVKADGTYAKLMEKWFGGQ